MKTIVIANIFVANLVKEFPLAVVEEAYYHQGKHQNRDDYHLHIPSSLSDFIDLFGKFDYKRSIVAAIAVLTSVEGLLDQIHNIVIS